ncbi:MAG: hypothetical protein QW638_00895 [Candidatus Bathyarchaeia archaeon]|nr:hypothetical protein [Candidatus Bathyarchaeota archaeon]
MERVRVEIYEGDPFVGCCGPRIASKEDVDRLRNMLTERNHIIKALKEEFKDKIEIERDIISTRRRLETYPRHIYKLLVAGIKVPFVVIEGQLALEGEFPNLEEFRSLIKEHIDKRHKSP